MLPYQKIIDELLVQMDKEETSPVKIKLYTITEGFYKGCTVFQKDKIWFRTKQKLLQDDITKIESMLSSFEISKYLESINEDKIWGSGIAFSSYLGMTDV